MLSESTPSFDPYANPDQSEFDATKFTDGSFLESLGAAVGPPGPSGLPGATGPTWLQVVPVAESLTLTSAHVNGFVKQDLDIPSTVTVPDDATIPLGSTVRVAQHGNGSVTIVAAKGVTLLSHKGQLKLAGRHAVVTLVKTGPNEWYAFGDLVL